MSRKRSGHQDMLNWLKSRLVGYQNVNIVDFTSSWVDGMQFLSIILYYYNHNSQNLDDNES